MTSAFQGFRVCNYPTIITFDGGEAPLATGTPLEGLENLFTNTVWHRHRQYPYPVDEPTVPERVICSVPIKVSPSGIGAGRGVFVRSNVPAGDLIFSIKKPFLNIVNGGPGLSSSCDNFMVGRFQIYFTGPDASVKFEKCGGCKTLYYCSKDCQKAAWKHHHKFECETFQGMVDAGAEAPLQMTDMRFVIRLLRLHANERISNTELTEFLSLPSYKEAVTKSNTHLEESAGSCARVAKKFTKTIIDTEAIENLFYLILTTPIHIVQPTLKGGRCYDSKTRLGLARSVFDVGKFVDTFVSLIQHCCQPNAFLWYEGPELRVRASKEIRKGDELTFCYAPVPYDYTQRQLALVQQWGIDCACDLCESKGPVSLPEGSLRNRVLALSTLITNVNLAEVETAIHDILQVGYGYGTVPLWDLYFQTIRVNLQRGKTSDCLKAALKMYYLVEPAQIPQTVLSDRISTLYVIVSLMNVPQRSSTKLEEFPDQVKHIIPHVFFHLRARLVAATEKCFGADSAVAKFEKKTFRAMLETLEEVAQKQGHKFEYEPLKNNNSETRVFVEKMNELLEWAGIPARTEAQLLAE